MKVGPLAVVLWFALAFSQMAAAAGKTLQFAGHDWSVRTEKGMPGPNRFSADNAWVDSEGALHLRISQIDGKWQCAEVDCADPVKFGTFDFEVEGPINHLDESAVLGMFTYPTTEDGPDGTNEIDVELSHWDVPHSSIVNYTVYPAKVGLGQRALSPKAVFTSDVSFHRFVWSPDSVKFFSYDAAAPDPTRIAAIWIFAPRNSSAHISQRSQLLLINLWLNESRPPSNGQPIEFKIVGMRYTPSGE